MILSNRANPYSIDQVAESLAINLVHIIFSTKNREPFLDKGTRERLYPYMAQLIPIKGSECYRIGGVERCRSFGDSTLKDGDL